MRKIDFDNEKPTSVCYLTDEDLERWKAELTKEYGFQTWEEMLEVFAAKMIPTSTMRHHIQRLLFLTQERPDLMSHDYIDDYLGEEEDL